MRRRIARALQAGLIVIASSFLFLSGASYRGSLSIGARLPGGHSAIFVADGGKGVVAFAGHRLYSRDGRITWHGSNQRLVRAHPWLGMERGLSGAAFYVPLPLLALVCLAWPASSFIIARCKRRRGFPVEPSVAPLRLGEVPSEVKTPAGKSIFMRISQAALSTWRARVRVLLLGLGLVMVVWLPVSFYFTAFLICPWPGGMLVLVVQKGSLTATVGWNAKQEFSFNAGFSLDPTISQVEGRYLLPALRSGTDVVTYAAVQIPLWLLAFLCLAWPVSSFIIARRKRRRGFPVEPKSSDSEAPKVRSNEAQGASPG